MTDEELSHIESLYRNPPSASLPADLGLRLCAEIRRLNAALEAEIAAPRLTVAPPLSAAELSSFMAEPAPVVIDDRKKKKGGK